MGWNSLHLRLGLPHTRLWECPPHKFWVLPQGGQIGRNVMLDRRLGLLCGAISCGIVAIALGVSGVLDEAVAARSGKAQDAGLSVPTDDDGKISMRLNLPRGTVIRDDHVLGMSGRILAAIERSDDGIDQADVRTVGRSVVNGVQRNPDHVLSWGDHVDLGAFYNAGDHSATILFDSHLIVEIEPGEVVLVSALLPYDDLVEVVESDLLQGKCACECFGCGTDETVACEDVVYVENCAAGDCDCLNENEETCVVEIGEPPSTQQCEGILLGCTKKWIRP